MPTKSNIVRSERTVFRNEQLKAREKSNKKGNVIIQCPKCQTKFSVSSELISELELPRFHCSRCDNVFDMDPRSDASFEDNDIPKEEIQLPKEPDIRPPSFDIKSDYKEAAFSSIQNTISQDQQDETEEKKNSSTIEVSKEDLKRITSAVISEVAKKQEEDKIEKTAEIKETIEFNFEPQQVKSLEIPKNFSPEIPVAPPIESIPDEVSKEQFTDYKKYEPLKAEQLSMDLQSDQFDSDKTEETMPYGMSFGNPISRISDEELADLNPPSFNTEQEESPVYLKNSMSALAVFFMPLLFTLICTGLISIYLINSPQAAEALAGRIGMPLPQTAPKGLYIDNVRFSKLALDNGESIYVISGKIKNDSQSRLNNILLEGFIYDQAGKIAGSVKASAASGLDLSRLKSLTSEMIRNMQDQKASKKFELSPGGMQDFVIAMDSGSIPNAKITPEFFSARIHSVTSS